jgi:RNA polymerase sigma-70 factor, ECF subfamily
MGEILPLRGAGKPGAVVEVTLDGRTDEELMALVRLDARAAFRVLVVRHAERVAAFCARMTGDRTAAPEIAQEVWLSVWDARGRWEPRSTFASYLYTIAFRRARNHARSRRRRAAVFASEPLDPEVSPRAARSDVDALLERERQERVFQAIGELPAAMRDAMILRFVDELSYEEMETILSVNPATLRSRVHHALLRLKKRLGKEHR